MNLTVDVVSDVICPWCYIGKRRLENAVAEFDSPVDVRWHPFQLNPAMPKAGITRREYRTRKFGSWERSRELDANVSATGAAEGIEFAFDKVQRTPNTVDAHRVIWSAGQHGCLDPVVEALFSAYFTQGLDIGITETLLDVAARAGLNQEEVEDMLNNGGGMEALATGTKISQQHNVTSVPFFIVNDEFTLSGAQASESFLEAFKLASDHG